MSALLAGLSSIDTKWLLGGVGAIVLAIFHFLSVRRAKKKGEAEVLGKITEMDAKSIRKDVEKREEIKRQLNKAVSTLNGVGWDDINRIRKEHGLVNLTDVIKFIKESKDAAND